MYVCIYIYIYIYMYIYIYNFLHVPGYQTPIKVEHMYSFMKIAKRFNVIVLVFGKLTKRKLNINYLIYCKFSKFNC